MNNKLNAYVFLVEKEKDGKTFNNLYISVGDGLLTLPINVKIFENKDGRKVYRDYDKLVNYLKKQSEVK